MVAVQPIASKSLPDLEPLPLYVCPFVVISDTREQAPWTFTGQTFGGHLWIVTRQVATLETGDYSILGYEEAIVIERKSAEDLLGSITSANARFRREHERMAELVEHGGFAAVVIEGCLATICEELDGPNSSRKIGSDVVIGITAAWPRRYRVLWFFAGDRRRADLLAFRLLWKWWEDFLTLKGEMK